MTWKVDGLGRKHQKIVDREEFPWVYGRTVFESGVVIPWMKLCDDAKPGYATRYVTIIWWDTMDDKGVRNITRRTKEWAYVAKEYTTWLWRREDGFE